MSYAPFPDIEATSSVFGSNARIYGALINDISSSLLNEHYVFEPDDEWQLKLRGLNVTGGRQSAGKTYWTEILFRAHMYAIASILRTTRWVDVAVREYAAGSLFGWASACRSLIEAAGDSGYSLGAVPLTLAEHHRKIQAEVKGKGSGPVFLSSELENTLIHFSHARKKTDGAPESHKARPTWEYLKFIEGMKITGSKELYGHLCELVHPASESVSTMFVATEGGLIIRPENERFVLDHLARKSRDILSEVLMAAYNPPILILRVLHKFGIFTQIDALRKYTFDNIALWGKMEKFLRS